MDSVAPPYSASGVHRPPRAISRSARVCSESVRCHRATLVSGGGNRRVAVDPQPPRVHATLEEAGQTIRQQPESFVGRVRADERNRERRLETNWQFRAYNTAQTKRLLKSVPAFQLVAVHDFNYDMEMKYELDDDMADTVLILRKR